MRRIAAALFSLFAFALAMHSESSLPAIAQNAATPSPSPSSTTSASPSPAGTLCTYFVLTRDAGGYKKGDAFLNPPPAALANSGVLSGPTICGNLNANTPTPTPSNTAAAATAAPTPYQVCGSFVSTDVRSGFSLGSVFSQILSSLFAYFQLEPTPCPTTSPTASASGSPSPTPTGSVTNSPAPTASPTQSPSVPTPTPSPTGTASPTNSPTASAAASATPSASPSTIAFPIVYTPSGGPISAAAAPGLAQFVFNGLADTYGNGFSVSASNVLEDASNNGYGSFLADTGATGASTVANSSCIVYFTGSAVVFPACYSRLNGNLAAGTGLSDYHIRITGSSNSDAIVVSIENNGTTSSTTSATTTISVNQLYALKVDVTGVPGVITAKLFSVTSGTATQLLSINVTDPNSAIVSGYNALRMYAPNNSNGITSLGFYNSVVPDSTVGTIASASPSSSPTASAAPTASPTPVAVGANDATPDASERFYSAFTGDTVNTLPSGFVSAQYANQAPAAYVISNANGVNVLSEPAGSSTNDVLYYPLSTPLTSAEESYKFVYAGTQSVPEPYFVLSSAVNAGTSLNGYGVNLTPAAANNTSAGNVYYRYTSGGVTTNQTLGRLRDEPYHYLLGHTYRVDAVLNPSLSLLTTTVSDTAYGSVAFDTTTQNFTSSSASVFPGILNRYGAAIAITDFNFGHAGDLAISPRSPRRASDYFNFMGENASCGGTNTATIACQAVAQYLPETLIHHNRISADGTPTYPTQNLMASAGVDTTALTSNATTVASLTAFCANLTNGCESVEMADEPNNYNTDANYISDLPPQTANFASNLTSLNGSPKNIWLPSFLANSNNQPSAMASEAPFTNASASPVPQPSPIAYYANAWNTHSYTQSPDNKGFGGLIAGCGTVGFDFPNEDCGYYGSVEYNDNESRVVDITGALPGVSTEGAASFGSSNNICGNSNPDMLTQAAYVMEGYDVNFMRGHTRAYSYKFADDGGCSDGFGTYGILWRLRNNDSTTYQIDPKPAFTLLANANHLVYDWGCGYSCTFTPQPISIALSGATPDVRHMLLAESDGSYRLKVWSNAPLWNWTTYTPIAPVSESVTLRLAASASVTCYTPSTSTWNYSMGSTTTGTSATINFSNYEEICDIIPTSSSATPEPLPTGIDTPGAVETKAPAAPTPIPTSTSAVVVDNFASYTPGPNVIPPEITTNAAAAPWTVFTSGSGNQFGENSTNGLNLNYSTTTSSNFPDKAWINTAYAQSLESAIEFTPSSSTPQICMFFPTAGTIQNDFVVKTTGAFLYQYNASGVTNVSQSAAMSPNKSTLVAGDLYAWKVKVTNPGSGASAFSQDIYDISAGATDPGYGSSVTAQEGTYSSTSGITGGVENCTANQTSTFGISFIAVAYNGATLPPFPTPTASPSPTPTPVPTATNTPSPTASPTSTPTLSPVPTASPTATASLSATPQPTSTPTPGPTNTPTPSPSPTNTPSPSPSPTNSPAPTATPTPSPTPTFAIAYIPSGGPTAAASAPGFAQLATANLADNTGNVYSLNASNQIVPIAAPSAYPGFLSDSPQSGSTLNYSSTIAYFTASTSSSPTLYARLSGNIAAQTGLYFFRAKLIPNGTTATIQLVYSNNGTATALFTTSSFPYTAGALYALKLDIVPGASGTLVGSLYSTTGSVTQITTTSYGSGYSPPAGVNALQFYSPNGTDGASEIDVFSSPQPASVVHTTTGGTVAVTPSPVPTASPTVSPTPTASAVPTATPTSTPSATAVPTASAAPTSTPTVAPSASPSPTSTPSPTAAPTATPTIAPTATPSPTATPTKTPSPAPTSTPTPTPTPTVSPTPNAVGTVVYSQNFDSLAPGAIPSAFATSAGSDFKTIASSTTNSSPNEFGETSDGATNDLVWLNGYYSTTGMDVVASFLPQNSSNAGIALMAYSFDGQYFSLNLASGNASYFANSSASAVTLSGQSGHVSSYTANTYYCAEFQLSTASTTYSMSSRVWPCSGTKPSFGNAITTTAYTMPYVTGGIRNNFGAMSTFDDFSVGLSGATPSPPPSTSTAIPTATPTATPVVTPTPVATPTASPTPTAAPTNVANDNFDNDATSASAPNFTSIAGTWSVLSTTSALTNTAPNYFGQSAGAQNNMVYYAAQTSTTSEESRFSFFPQTDINAGISATIYSPSQNLAYVVNLFNGNLSYYPTPGSGSGSTQVGSLMSQSNSFLPHTFYCADFVATYNGTSDSFQDAVWPCASTEPSLSTAVTVSTNVLTQLAAAFRNNYGSTAGFDDFAAYANGASPAPIPSPIPTTALTPQPGSTASNVPYDPPAGTYPYFPKSVFLATIAPSPSPDPSSSAWVASEQDSNGNISFGNFQFAMTSAGLVQDYMFPIYYNDSSKNNGLGYEVHCTVNYTCPADKYIVHIPAGSNYLPESCGTSCATLTSDRHFDFIDTVNQIENDNYYTQFPAGNNAPSILTVGNGGQCSLANTGYDNCDTSATSVATSLGIVRVSDLMLAIQSSTGTLPYALQVSGACDGGPNRAPFTGTSDGKFTHCPTAGFGPPEGTRWFFAMHDAQVNALGLAAIPTAMIRTMDEDHYGWFFTDTDGASSGFSFQAESDLTYEGPNGTAAGTGPWATTFLTEAKKEGLTGSNCTSSNSICQVNVGIPTTGMAITVLHS